MSSPDAAYLSPETLAGIPPPGVRGLPHLCPDFVIELLSRSDSFSDTQEKMQDWIANGGALGWLIDPYKQQVLVYRPTSDTESVTSSSIQGIGPVEGFTLDLAEVWRCYQ